MSPIYLLDTNACIHLLNGSAPALGERLQQEDPNRIAICSVVKAELEYGARRSTRVAANLRLLRRFYEPLQSFPFDDRCAEQYGMIRAELERTGASIGPNDLMIAAIARSHDLVLVTHNADEFARVGGLQAQDWESES